jgi:transcriptional regulator with XRE-family HTH domain
MPQEMNVPEWSSAILRLRQRLGLSQSDFGSRMHYSAMAVSRWETGKQEPTSRCFIQLGNMAGQPAGVLAVLGPRRAQEFRPPPDASRHARHRAHDDLRGF